MGVGKTVIILQTQSSRAGAWTELGNTNQCNFYLHLRVYCLILYMSNSKTRLWLVFTLFSFFLLAERFVQFGMPIGKLA